MLRKITNVVWNFPGVISDLFFVFMMIPSTNKDGFFNPQVPLLRSKHDLRHLAVALNTIT